jgi:beta-glucanase (GH16 family)
VRNGMLIISAYQEQRGGNWVSGGLQTAHAQTYGKYLVRCRFGPGWGISDALLLWPANDRFPPEIDFSEAYGRSNLKSSAATFHYGKNIHLDNSVAVDLTQWHTFGVEWTPGKLVYTLDGHAWGTVVNPHVPHIPMRLCIQTQSYGLQPTPAVINLEVDWVVIYAPDRARRSSQQ